MPIGSRYNGGGSIQGVVIEGQVDATGAVVPVPGGSSSSPIVVRDAGGTATNRSGTITTGATAQVLAAANANRRYLNGQNRSTGDLYVNETGTASATAGAGNYLVAAGGYFSITTVGAISIYGATTGQAFEATEVQ